jgi:hypothetical protein
MMDSESLCVSYAPSTRRELEMDDADDLIFAKHAMNWTATERWIGQMRMSLEQFQSRHDDIERLCGP